MKSGLIVLYTGAAIAAIATLMCLVGWPKLTKTWLGIIWGVAMILLIVGAFLEKSQENYCCNNSYAQIFNTPMNVVRDPDEPEPEREYKERLVEQDYTRNQYARIPARRNAISQQYRQYY
jgi:hypothetical protein